MTKTSKNTVSVLKASEITRGMVVQFADRIRRRYQVVARDCTGQLYLVALSGGPRGSAPSGVRPGQLVRAEDQTVEFTGSKAAYLRRRAGLGLATHPW